MAKKKTAKKKTAKKKTAGTYAKHRQRAGQRQRDLADAGRDIGEIPKVEDKRLRARCEKNFRLFCETVFPPQFPLPFSKDHLTVIGEISRSIVDGDQLAVAMPRGSGKTTLLICAAFWAIITGRHPFAFLIASNRPAAVSLLNAIRTHSETNATLLALWPEIFFPIRKLEKIGNRVAGQTYNGAPTYIRWGVEQIIFPTIPGSKASGAAIAAAGLLGWIRGRFVIRPATGETLRPTWVAVDDPQTEASAKSFTQCNNREEIITSAVLGLAGPDRRTAVYAAVTNIASDDLAARLTDRTRRPEFHGIRQRFLYRMPDNIELWAKYYERLAIGQRDGTGEQAAQDYYRKRRRAMDKGAKVAWPESVKEGYVSALEFAMRTYFADPLRFAKELQNDADTAATSATAEIDTSASLLVNRTIGVERGTIDATCNTLTLFIDCGKRLLWFALCAFDADTFDGHLVDFGTFPEQGLAHFSKRRITRTLIRAYPGKSEETRLYNGLNTLLDLIESRHWLRTDGVELAIDSALIDGGYLTNVVRRVCRDRRNPILRRSHGKGISARQTPISDWKKGAGKRIGEEWQLSRAAGSRQRHVLFDSNYWKTFLRRRLIAGLGDAGAFAFPAGPVAERQIVADHLLAETPIDETAGGRTIYAWQLPPHEPDNDYLDCLVGCHVAASVAGVRLASVDSRDRGAPADPIDRRQVSSGVDFADLIAAQK